MDRFEGLQEIEPNAHQSRAAARAAARRSPRQTDALPYEPPTRGSARVRILPREEEFALATALCANRTAFETLMESLPRTFGFSRRSASGAVDRRHPWRTISEMESSNARLSSIHLERPGEISRETVAEAGRLVREILAAREMLIRCNIGFVVRTARQFVGRRMLLEDLVQEGMSGLITAVDQYDPERGRVTTYARFWIERSIKRALLSQPHTIRRPVRLGTEIGALLRTTRELETTLGRAPAEQEVAQRMGVSERKVLDLQAVLRDPVALETSENEAGSIGPLGRIADPNAEDPLETLSRRQRLEDLAAALAQLNPRERKVLGRRFGMNGYGVPETLQEIGTILGVSRERTRKIELNAMAKLRRILCPQAAGCGPAAPRVSTAR
jgi:RNA polymerase sigma factor (sigma-70 family)